MTIPPAVGLKAPEILERARCLVEPVLRESVGQLPGSMSRALGYQLGWCDEHGAPVRAGRGKGVRPALAVLSAEAVGGRAEDAVRAAAAVELVHNFSLVHDDIMDGDATRRHRPTVWAAFGVPIAVLAGDALLALAMRVLAASSSPGAARGTRGFAETLMELLAGQGADLDFEERAEVGCAEYVAMAGGKTAALMGYACAAGALFGGADEAGVGCLRRFGRHLGLAFQMVDDLLGIWGDPAVTGKPARSDVRSKKKTFPVISALASDSSAGQALADWYRRAGRIDEEEVRMAVRWIEQAGARERTEAEAQRHLGLALRALDTANPPPRTAAELCALAHLATRRDR
ncbi:polyprenyl synthetase family protein [Amycolatopsis anabasis]|uniref:polyprenyl synthetase family protein n=1 Tax=Amycolatopsis anabasis TaxID=1840409 RepID=UPI00131E62C2|nr:polyprenyl synthetase family protein [Amycolatopsis anabasis]